MNGHFIRGRPARLGAWNEKGGAASGADRFIPCPDSFHNNLLVIINLNIFYTL